MGTLTTPAALVPDPGRGVPYSALRRQAQPSEQTRHTAGSAFPSVLPVKVSGTPLLPSSSAKEPEAIVGPARTHTHTRDTHGCSHSTRPTVLVRAVKWSFTNSTGGWVTTKVTKTKRQSCVTWVHSSEHGKGVRSLAGRAESQGRTETAPSAARLPVPGRAPRPPGQGGRRNTPRATSDAA